MLRPLELDEDQVAADSIVDLRGGLRCRTSAEPPSCYPSKPKEQQHWHHNEYAQKYRERFRLIHDVRVRTVERNEAEILSQLCE